MWVSQSVHRFTDDLTNALSTQPELIGDFLERVGITIHKPETQLNDPQLSIGQLA
jgi:hypothetical protein